MILIIASLRMILRIAAHLGLSLSLVALSGCSSGNESSSTILATTSVWADITSHTLCDIEVDSLIAPGSDPHSYEPSLRDRQRLEGAELVVANGAHLEDRYADLLTTADELVILADHVSLRQISADHDHDGTDPHFWMDPTLVADLVMVIADHRDTSESCATAYRDELLALDADIASMVATIPPDQRILVTNHDALGYFADRYGFDVVGTVIPSLTTMAEPSAANLADLAETIEATGARAIFTEELGHDADATALGQRLGIPVIALATGTLDPSGDRSTYVEMMRSNTTLIVDALSGS
ncbi:MAG: zinc ABC transporter substrate-binding protein [Ilumatobacter coccineus]|uniref:Zinc ABC transporter substrate-binding protein n=1 Tax=Ilumatobacter coccineus TaxID=467094 RepID=A0A2G6KFJ0_9ACTN|nr:MAG: zinc ABC transporter substrate-binding protein [Ilumatobacter coccineus]